MFYFGIIKVGLEKAKNMKNLVLFEVLSVILSTLFISIIWFVIMQKTGEIKGYTFSSIVHYYFFMQFLSSLYYIGKMGLEWEISRLIKIGDISNFLIRPINFFLFIILRNIGYSIPSLVVSFLFFFLFFLFKGYNLVDLFILLAIIIISVLFFIIYSITIGLLAFWIEDISIVSQLLYTIFFLFSGRLLPLDFYPEWLLKIANWLPFKYMYYLPSAYFSSKITTYELIKGLVILVVWTLVLYLIFILLYKRGLKKLRVYGG